jgi:hypothetical protein
MRAKNERRPLSWVVYRVMLKGNVAGPNAVCEQAEWEEMERRHPGAHTLLRSGIASEGEAERLARGTSGDSAPRGVRTPTGVTRWRDNARLTGRPSFRLPGALVLGRSGSRRPGSGRARGRGPARATFLPGAPP